MTTTQRLLISRPGKQGTRVLLRAATDTEGRTWPVGTAYYDASAGRDNEVGCDYQTVQIAQREWQTVLTEGFGVSATFRGPTESDE